MDKIIALVVTFNRKELLSECLQALFNQSRKPDAIIVIDNNSTDGTEELFADSSLLSKHNIIYRKLPENIGGSGGFYEGIKQIDSLEYDWLWLMDDDTIPSTTALEELIHCSGFMPEASFFASSVFGPDNEPMNVPKISNAKAVNGYRDWYLDLDKCMVKLESATFVSLLINCKAVKKIGYPVRDYFIWGDDTEYTMRLTKYYGKAYLCGKSKVLHKRFNARAIGIKEEENINRISIYHYYYRNTLINSLAYSGKFKLIAWIARFELEAIQILFSKRTIAKWKKFIIIQRGICEFIFRRYNVQEFKNRIPDSI